MLKDKIKIIKKSEGLSQEKLAIYYWSKLYSQNIKQGKAYHELERCIVVLIEDFELDGLK